MLVLFFSQRFQFKISSQVTYSHCTRNVIEAIYSSVSDPMMNDTISRSLSK